MSTWITIEPLGGYTGSGAPANQFQNAGRLNLSSLSDHEREQVEALFAMPREEKGNFQFRLTLEDDDGKRIVEASAASVPESLIRSIHTTWTLPLTDQQSK